MNNDIANLTNHIGQKIPQKHPQTRVEPENAGVKNSKNLDSSLSYLNSIGHAQVNMNADISSITPTNSVIYSMDIFKNNPDGVENYNDFIDELIARGYSLEKAIDKADAIFSCLKESATYQN